MKKILITFLGAGNYAPCIYRIDEATYANTRFFCVALARHLQPDSVISLETHEATAKHGSELSSALADWKHDATLIPRGASETELWDIFRVITEQVPAEAEVHVDITHGFRSLPLIGLIALSYLRTTRRVSIGGIHYGAFEAKDSADVVPAFDLTAFVDLLDWSAAADQFLSTGSGVRLSQLLRETQRSLWKGGGNTDKKSLPKKLNSLAQAIATTSRDLIHLRLAAIPASVENVTRLLDDTEAEAGTFARPFLEVIEPVREEMGRFANASLTELRDLIGWLAERGHTSAALALAREWLTSYAMEWLGKPSRGSHEKDRKPYDAVLQLMLERQKKDANGPERTFDPDTETQLATLMEQPVGTHVAEIARLHAKITAARNDLMHAGYRQHPAGAASLQATAASVAEELAALPLPPAMTDTGEAANVRERPAASNPLADPV